MFNREKVTKGLECCKRKDGNECKVCPYTESEYCTEDMVTDVLTLLNEQNELLRKLQKDKDKLCLDVSEWKHKFYDRPEQDKENGHWIVLEYCANEGIYCSKCTNKIFDHSTKPKKKLSNYCPNCGSKNTHFFNPSTDKIMYSD